MKFDFKIQQYQTDAVDSIVDVFKGESFNDSNSYRFDFGDVTSRQRTFDVESDSFIRDDSLAYSNHPISIPPEVMLDNIVRLQDRYDLKRSKSLDTSLGQVSLDPKFCAC